MPSLCPWCHIQEKGENKVEEDRSSIDPSRCGIVKNNQGAYVSKNEAYALAQTVKDMFVANGIEYEVQQAVCKGR